MGCHGCRYRWGGHDASLERQVTEYVHVLNEEGGKRELAVDSYGAQDGTPIFLLHGTPGSRSGPLPRASVLYRLGIRLISYDRPGYGGSSRAYGRTVAGAADDVLAIARHLNIAEFAVVGRSGGGPHALACAARLAEVKCAAVLVGLAPKDATDLNWYDGMTGSNTRDYGRADDNPDLVTADLTQRADEVRSDPESLLRILSPELTTHDRKVVNDVAIRRQLMRTYEKALQSGPDGWIDDVLAFRRPWGFDVATIEHPVLLWHGANDVFSPASHTDWLANHIPNARSYIGPEAGHFDALKILPDILVRVKAAVTSEGLWV